MIPLKETHVLLWSFSQGCFHCETLDETVASGQLAFAENRSFQDYIVLAVASTREEIDTVRVALVARYGRPEPTKIHAPAAK
mgnify:CR=1 FL=1